MSTLDKIEALVTQAEAEEPQYHPASLNEAREILAEAALAGEKLDPKRLEALVLRCSKNSGDHTTPVRLISWGNFMGNVVDFLREGIVGMRDGRLATPDGWDYSNCEPDSLHCSRINKALSVRLENHISTLTDAEGSNDPEKNPDEYDELHDELVEKAIKEHLDRLGAPA